MLWYDDDKVRTLTQKIERAAAYYRAKYGRAATECYVNPVMLGAGSPESVSGVRLVSSRTVIKNHFWLGVGEPETA
jgi:hypothetical protein